MPKTYLIYEGYYEDRAVIGVCSSRKKADRIVELYRYSDEPGCHGDLLNALGYKVEIVEMDVDALPEPKLWHLEVQKPTRRNPGELYVLNVAQEPLPCQFVTGHTYHAVVAAENAMAARDIGLQQYRAWRATNAKWPQEDDNAVHAI